MTGYTKTKTFTNGETIDAEDFTTEFNNVSVAFDESTGHTHNGDADSGAYVPLISSADTFTKITTTEATDQLNFYTKVSGAAALQLSIKDGVIEPGLDSDVDIGTTAKRFKDLYVDSATVTGTLSATNATIAGTASFEDQITILGATAQAGAQPTLTLRSNEAASTDNQLGELTFQGHNNQQVDQTYAYMRAESPVITDNQEEGKFKFFVRKTGNAYANTLTLDSAGIDVIGTVAASDGLTADYIDLTGGESTTTTGTIACKQIVLNDPTSTNDGTDGTDLAKIYTESTITNRSSLVIHSADDGNDQIVLRTDNDVDVLVADSQGINVTGTVDCDGLKMDDGEYAQFGTANDLQIFHSGTHSYIKDRGTGILSIQSDGDSITFHDSANARDMAKFSVGGTASLNWAGGTGAGTKLATTATGIDVTGEVKGDTLTIDNGSGDTNGYIASSSGATRFTVKSTHDGEEVKEVAGVEIGAKSLSYLDLKTPDTDDYDLRIYHSEPANHSMIDSLDEDLYLRSGGKVALQHAGANTKLETTTTGIDVTGDVAATTVTVGDGTSTDLKLYKDASDNCFIEQRGVGGLDISGIYGKLSNESNQELISWDTDNAALSYRGAVGAGLKLTTTATGINVTGTVAASDGLTADYIDLTGGKTTTTTGEVALDKIKFSAMADDSATIFAEVNGGVTTLVLDMQDDVHELIEHRIDGATPLKVKKTGIDVTGVVKSTKGFYTDYKNHGDFPTTDSWYTIAICKGRDAVTTIQRASGEFTVVDNTDAAGHETVRFTASELFAQDALISVSEYLSYSSTTIHRFRIKSGAAFEGSALQVYASSTVADLGVTLINDPYLQSDEGGWHLLDAPVIDSSDPSTLEGAGRTLGYAVGDDVNNRAWDWTNFTSKADTGFLNNPTGLTTTSGVSVGDNLEVTGNVNLSGAITWALPDETDETPSTDSPKIEAVTYGANNSTTALDFVITDDANQDRFRFRGSFFNATDVNGDGIQNDNLGYHSMMELYSTDGNSLTSAVLDVTGTVEANAFSGTGSVAITDFIDDDTFGTATDTNVPTAESVKAYVDAETAAASAGDITSVVAGDGLTGGATSGDATVNVVGGVGIVANADEVVLDLNELTTSEDDADGDFFAVVDTDGAQKKLTKANIALSGMDNDSGWTSNAGTVTGVTVGTGLDVSNGTTAPALSLDFTEFSDMTADVEGTTEVILNNAGTESRKAISEINLSTFNNDLTFANTDTTYTAGTGLTLSAGDEFSVNEAQSGITSLGTLSALNVTGDLTLEALYPTGTGNLFLGTASGGSAVDSTSQYNTGVGNGALGAVTTATFNTAVGGAALQSLTTGTNNVAFGLNASKSVVGASNNSSFGVSALNSLVSGSSNTALGIYAGYSLTTASGNVLVGASAGYDLTSGGNNIVLGNNAARKAGTVTNSVVIGQDAGYNLGSQGGIIAIGHDAMKGSAVAGAFTGGEACIAIGENALESITTAVRCTAIGDQAGLNITTGGSNTLVGQLAGTEITTGTLNVAIGDNAGRGITTSSNTIAIGTYAGQYLGPNSVAVGPLAGQYQKGQNNTFLGMDAGQGSSAYVGTSHGTKNTAIGSNAFEALTTGDYNVAVGHEALVAGTVCNYNTAIGASALKLLTTGVNNTAIGYLAAGYTSTNVGSSTSIGSGAGMFTGTGSVSVGDITGFNQDGQYNTFIGRQAGYGSSTYRNSGAAGATENTGIGHTSLYSLAGGDFNTAIGRASGLSLTTGDSNTLLGKSSGYDLTTGSSNVLVGSLAGQNITTGSNNIVIGTGSGIGLSTANNVTIIGSFSGTSPDLDSAAYAGAVAISSNDPSYPDPLLFMEKNGNVSIPANNGLWSAANGGFKFENAADTKILKWARGSSSSTNVYAQLFFNSTGSIIGSINTTSTGISISYTSDYRLKENVSPLTGSIDRLKALKPCTFNFLSEPTRQEEGFIAHEVQEVVPQAVVGVKDAVDENGDAELQGVDPSRIVVILTGALQEAIEKIEQLEERISALEA